MNQTDFSQFTKIPQKSIEERIRLDCYYGRLKSYESKYPDAHFEDISRASDSILAPSWSLLKKAGITQNSENPKMPFEKYEPLFFKELLDNPSAIKRMKELLEIAQEKDVFLVCWCKNASECHRSSVKKIMLKLYNKMNKKGEKSWK